MKAGWTFAIPQRLFSPSGSCKSSRKFEPQTYFCRFIGADSVVAYLSWRPFRSSYRPALEDWFPGRPPWQMARASPPPPVDPAA